MESILTSIKKMLGIAEEYTHFDADIIFQINSVFMALNQMGVGPKNGFIVKGSLDTWEQFLGYSTNVDPYAAYSEVETPSIYIEAVKTYTFYKVKLGFDNATLNSAQIEAYNRQIAELEWRITLQAEKTNISEED